MDRVISRYFQNCLTSWKRSSNQPPKFRVFNHFLSRNNDLLGEIGGQYFQISDILASLPSIVARRASVSECNCFACSSMCRAGSCKYAEASEECQGAEAAYVGKVLHVLDHYANTKS